MANKNLSAAKKAKQDEFYTQMNDIQAEINAYLDYDENTFRGKTVLLPCNDPEWSNFALFFAQNFERLGLKKLISTSYAPESKTAKYGSLFAYAASQGDKAPKNERNKFPMADTDNVPKWFDGLGADRQKRFLDTPLTVYVCEGEREEIREWFKTINIAGVPLVQQELLNAIYSGPFVTAAKSVFSNSSNSDMQRWKNYVSGNERRQDVLVTALSWVARGKENIESYMGRHIADADCGELKAYFASEIDWIDGRFKGVTDEMCGLEWGACTNGSMPTPTTPTRCRGEWRIC